MDQAKLRKYVYDASVPFFGGPPTPSWLDYDDPVMIGDQKPPPLAYHYATPPGFAGILASHGQVWATLHRCLNDAKEISFGYGVVRRVVDDLLQPLGGAAPLLIEKLEALSQEDSFLASFSETPHVLSQWRAYAGDGAGYCIGFRLSPIQTSGYHAINAYRYLLKCGYGAERVAQGFRDLLLRKITRIGTLVTQQPQFAAERDRFLALEASMLAWRYAHLAKHEHFEEEKELRFIVGGRLNADQFAVRVGPRGLIPYVLTGELPIEEVWIGPGIGPSEEVAVRAVEQLLRTNNLPNVAVRYWTSSYVGRR